MEALGAAPDLGGQVDALIGDAPLEPVDVPAGAEGAPGAGDDQRSNGSAIRQPGGRCGQLADQLGAHRVERVRPVERQRADLSVDRELQRFELGGIAGQQRNFGLCGLCHQSLLRRGDAEPTLLVVPKSSQKLADQRRELPDAPGVYVFRNRAGEALYVGKANSIRKRVGSHFAGKGGGRGSGMGGTAELIDRTESIEFLVTENEPEALLAEQAFIKRYRPRFNIRLRDDKSYPYVGVSLDEEFPRVYFTRERPRPTRAYFGPFSSAKRVRETLDLLGKLFQYRTCEGREPGRRSGVPCLDYYIKRCQAPCVGYIDKEE